MNHANNKKLNLRQIGHHVGKLMELGDRKISLFNPEERKAIFALRDQLTKTRRAQDASVATPTGQQLTLGAAIALPQALIPGVIQGIIESKPIRNLLIKRKAATTAKQRVLITNEIQAEINKAGLSGAALTGAALTDEGNK